MSYIVIAALILFAISAAARNNMLNALRAGGYLMQGTWARRPTMRAIWQYARWPLLIVMIPGLVFFLTIWGIGFYVNAPVAGLLIGLVFPIWLLFFVLSGIPVFGGITKPIFWFLTVIITPAVLWFSVGIWSPEVKGAINDYTRNGKGEIANFLNKKSLQAEPMAGIVGYAIEDGIIVYNAKDQRTPAKKLCKGDAVMVMSLTDTKPVNFEGEGMVLVKLANENGDFLGGRNGWVVSRKISWRQPDPAKQGLIAAPAPAQYEYAPTPAPTPEQYVAPTLQPESTKVAAPKWKFHWEGADVVVSIQKDAPLDATGELDDKVIIFTESSRNDDGTIVGKWECTGRDWHQWGTFSIKFRGDVATGSIDSTLEKSSLIGKKIS